MLARIRTNSPYTSWLKISERTHCVTKWSAEAPRHSDRLQRDRYRPLLETGIRRPAGKSYLSPHINKNPLDNSGFTSQDHNNVLGQFSTKRPSEQGYRRICVTEVSISIAGLVSAQENGWTGRYRTCTCSLPRRCGCRQRHQEASSCSLWSSKVKALIPAVPYWQTPWTSSLNVPFSPLPSSRPLSCGGPGAVHLQHQ